MNARDWGASGTAAERSAVYRSLAQACTYHGAGNSPFAIDGADFTAAFDPSVSEAAASLREGTYVEDDQSALFEELVRFYEFFGLGRGEGVEMPDHLSVELEFMQYLTHLEASASDRPDELASIRRAQRDFLTRHLRRLLQGLNQNFKREHPACVALIDTCSAFIEDELVLVEN